MLIRARGERSPTRRWRWASALALATLILGVAACGGDDEGSGDGAENGQAPEGSTETVAAYGEFDATLENGAYGENYDPSLEDVDQAIFGPEALPEVGMQRNVVLAGIARAQDEVDEEKALECWRTNDCETGTGGDLTVGLADGFGDNVARQVFKMEFILQALTYDEVGRIIYTDANLDTQKAISDVRSMIAQDVDVMVSFPDAGEALVPAYREATDQGIPVSLWANANIGTPGEDFLTYTGPDICALGEQYAEILNEQLSDGGEIASIGGPPANPQTPAWRECMNEALNENIEVVAEPDTEWTRQTALEAMSGVLSSNPDISGFVYDYGDATVGALRAFEAADIPLDDIVATVQSDDNPLLCRWRQIGNPDFKVWTYSALFTQGRIALTAGMMSLQDAPIPPEIIFQPSLRRVDEDSCRDDIPVNGSPSALVPAELQSRMFGE